MSEILKDVSRAAMKKAIEENMYAVTPLAHNWPKAEVYRGKDVNWCVTDMDFPTCNPIIHVNLKPESVDGVLTMLTDKARKKKVSLHCWIVDDTRPANLPNYLVKYGFTSQGYGAGMAIDLKNLNEENRAPKGLKITEVNDDATLKTWSRVAGTAFGTPEHVIDKIHAWYQREIALKHPLKCYLGLLNGKPVAVSQYFLGAGVCGLYFVGTLPEARNRGIGFSITQKPLLEAKKMGYRVGILQASKMGRPVYLKLGFKEYSRIGSYSWIYELNQSYQVSREYTLENERERNRLIQLVNSISDDELNIQIYKEGWTVATALGHLAFWDERRLALIKRWQQQKVLTPSDIDGVDMHTINDALVPTFLAMPPRQAAELAVSAAEKIDGLVTNLPARLITKINALKDRHALNRGYHRKIHLDEIEALLKAKHKKG